MSSGWSNNAFQNSLITLNSLKHLRLDYAWNADNMKNNFFVLVTP